MKATTPCVVAYAYARIRRLVRLGAGFYRLPVAEKQRWGLVARIFQVCSATFCEGFFVFAYMVAMRWASSDAPGSWDYRSTNLRMAATLVW